jgi:hypothetical protein
LLQEDITATINVATISHSKVFFITMVFKIGNKSNIKFKNGIDRYKKTAAKLPGSRLILWF